MEIDDDADLATAASMVNIRPKMLFATVSGSISALANLTKISLICCIASKPLNGLSMVLEVYITNGVHFATKGIYQE